MVRLKDKRKALSRQANRILEKSALGHDLDNLKGFIQKLCALNCCLRFVDMEKHEKLSALAPIGVEAPGVEAPGKEKEGTFDPLIGIYPFF